MILWFQAALIFITLILYPLAAWFIRGRGRPNGPLEKQQDRALFLPNGSFRAMLSMLVVGSFVNVLLGGMFHEGAVQNFDQVVTAFGTLSGSIVGFYFGARGTQTSEAKPAATGVGAGAKAGGSV